MLQTQTTRAAGSALLVAITAAFAADARSQTPTFYDIPAGSIIAALTPEGLSLMGPGGAQPIGFSGAIAPQSPNAFDFEQSSGRLITANDRNGAIEVFRNRVGTSSVPPVGGSVSPVVIQTSLGTIPGSEGLVPQEIYSEAQGSFLILAQSPAAPLVPVVFRIGLTSQGMVSYRLSGSASVDSVPMTDIMSSAAGDVFLTGPGSQSIVYAIEADSPGAGVVASAGVSYEVDLMAIEDTVPTGPSGPLFIGGGLGVVGPYGPGEGNFTVGGVNDSSLVSPTPANQPWPVIVDLDNEPNGDVLVSMNGPAGSGATIMRRPASGSATVVFSLPSSQITKARTWNPSMKNGYSGFRDAGLPVGMAPVPIEGNTPQLGNQWAVTVSGGPSSGSAVFMLGLDDTQSSYGPLPFDFTPLGVPGSALFTSADQTVFMSLDGAGAAAYTQMIPADPQWVGVTLFAQWIVEDPAMPGGFITSNALNATVIQ